MKNRFIEKSTAVWSGLECKLLPSYVWTRDPLTFWRERILFIICFIGAAFGPIALIPSLLLAYKEGLWNVIVIDLAAYTITVAILIARNAPFVVRALVCCFILYTLGVSLLFILGPIGAGYIWLFGASVLISAFIGLNAALWTLVLNAITLLGVGVFIAYGHPAWEFHVDNMLEKWLVMAGNFMLLNAFITITTAFMLNGLKKALLTEQKITESLQESDERFRTISETSHNAICILDDQGRIIWCNNRTLEISGYTRDQLLGAPSFLRFLVPESADMAKRNYGKLLAGEDYDHHYHFEFIGADGAKHLVENHMADYTDKQGRRNLIVSLLDITDLKRAEEERRALEKQLFESQKMEAIGTLAGGIAHDFNNILGAIMGYSELAAIDPDEKTRQSHIQRVLEASGRARDLVKQILSFSRHEKHDKKPIDMRFIVKEVLKLLAAATPATIEIRQALPDVICTVNADPTQIHQILMNLCTNAVHAMGEKGGVMGVSLSCITIDTLPDGPDMKPGSYVRLSVSDTGHGIEQEIISRIFDPFFTTKRVGSGTGLGLSVVYGIVKNHAGKITVASKPNQGATFNVYLPCIEAEKPGVDSRSVGSIRGGHELILFVDDDRFMAELGTGMLAPLGYTVVTHSDSVEALHEFRQDPQRYDLVITDMTMPRMTGRELAREIIGIRPGIPIIICTGFSEYIDAGKAKELGIRAFLMKPLARKDLAEAVRAALDGPQKDARNPLPAAP